MPELEVITVPCVDKAAYPDEYFAVADEQLCSKSRSWP
jgi:hypothetical protein